MAGPHLRENKGPNRRIAHPEVLSPIYGAPPAFITHEGNCAALKYYAAVCTCPVRPVMYAAASVALEAAVNMARLSSFRTRSQLSI